MILVIDNYDSFTFNLVQYLGELGADVAVYRNDAITVQEIESLAPQGIVLSPGPCTPKESGVCLEVLQAALEGDGPLSRTPILGVCLGHQAIGLVSGATVGSSRIIMHGKTSMIEHDGKGLYEGMESPVKVTRYHSLAVYEDTVPKTLVVTSRSLDDSDIMGLRHVSRPIEGVQFHPESVLTDQGRTMIQNFINKTLQLN